LRLEFSPKRHVLAVAQISEICPRILVCERGDSACGFANTAMQLAHQKMLPEVLAAVVRAMSAVRSLCAFEQGCGGSVKRLRLRGTGHQGHYRLPHFNGRQVGQFARIFSPLGNIAAAMCDLWSNESVQNVRLLSGNAPEVLPNSVLRLPSDEYRAEQKAARCNCAIDDRLRRVAEPQAAVLSPEATIRIAGAIVAADTPYHRVIARAAQLLNCSGRRHAQKTPPIPQGTAVAHAHRRGAERVSSRRGSAVARARIAIWQPLRQSKLWPLVCIDCLPDIRPAAHRRHPLTMRFKAIICQVFTREFEAVLARTSHSVDVENVPMGLHDLGVEMRGHLQERIDAADASGYDAILLGYALCGRGTEGLRAGKTQLVCPAHTTASAC